MEIEMSQPFVMIVHTDEAESGFSAFFPDAPGCVAAGETLGQLKADAASALRSHIDVSREEGLAIPVARDFDAVLSDPDVQENLKDAFVVLEARPLARSGRVKRVNITIDEFALDIIDRAAERVGSTRSAFMASAALGASEDANAA